MHFPELKKDMSTHLGEKTKTYTPDRINKSKFRHVKMNLQHIHIKDKDIKSYPKKKYKYLPRKM